MKYAPIDPHFFSANRSRLAAALRPGGLAILHSSDVPALCADGTSVFYQNSDLFYLAGADQEDTVLVLFPDAVDPAQREILFIRETSELIATWEGQKLTKEQAVAETGIANVQWTDQFDAVLRRLAAQVEIIYLNYNEHPRKGGAVETADDRFRVRCQSLYADHHYERLGPLMHELRAIKSATEIEITRKACNITHDGFLRVLKFVKPGVREYEIEAEYAHEFLRQGSKGFAYQPIIASGANGCVLHYLSNDQVCEDGQLILMDVGAEYANYNADMTRTIPVNGRFTERQRAVYEAVHRVLRKCIDDLIRPGVAIRDYQLQVARFMENELIGLGLIDAEVVAEERRLTKRAETDDEVKPPKEESKVFRNYFMHGTSHSLGLDVHDVTPLDPKFVENMLVTVEPGIYIRAEGLAVRLENNIVVRESGNVDLMGHIPIDADEIERLMAAGKRKFRID